MAEKGKRERADMNNKIKERILCLMLGVGVAAVVGVTGCGKSDASSDSEETAKTEDMQETADTKEESEPSENTKKQDSEEKDKTETVYVKSDAKGNPREITVQTKLKNTGDGDTIKDYTNLTDIKNKEGDEAFTQNADGTVEWENHGEDITYEGTGSAELPVDVSISYELDGQAIEPEELAGRSGQLKIRFDYKNKTTQTIKVDGKEEQVSVPFAVISTMLLSDDHASDIEVENGKVMDIDGQKLVIGYACPGLTKSLKLTTYEPTEDIDIPEYVEVTADVTDFSLDLTDMESAERQLEEDGTKLNEALTGMSTGLARMQQLAQEVGAYKTTVETQLETAKTALDAIDWAALDQEVRADSQAKADAAVEAAMQKALENYGLSADQIQAAQGEVKTAVNSALDQVSVSEEAKTQIQKAKDALEAIPTITIPEVSLDTEKLTETLTDMEKQMKILAGYGTTLGTVSQTAAASLQELQTGLTALQTGTVQLQEGSSQLEAGMAAFGEGIRQLYQGSAALHQGSGQLSSTGTVLIGGLDTMISGMDSLHQGLVKFDEDGIQEFSDLTGTDLTSLANRIRALKKADGRYDNYGGICEGASGSVRFIIETDEIKAE